VKAKLPDLVTSRLDLRRFHDDDLAELAVVFVQREVWQYPYGRGLTHDETAQFIETQNRHWLEHGFGCWVAREVSGGRVIGYLGLSVPAFLPEILPAVEVGWRIDPSVWGRGYATEGATAALDSAFNTLGLEHVCSIPQADNPASARVAERLGMRLMREVTIPANERRGALKALLYDIGREDWARVRAG
jgi:RimJ/RimL family protein N-acetyltransferase